MCCVRHVLFMHSHRQAALFGNNSNYNSEDTIGDDYGESRDRTVNEREGGEGGRERERERVPSARTTVSHVTGRSMRERGGRGGERGRGREYHRR